MNPKPNLSQVKTCPQNWDDMLQCGGGRLCLSCQQVIVDFRGKSDWEVALTHAQSEKRVCGIYDKRHFSAQPKKTGSAQLTSRKFLLAGTLGLLTANSPLLSQSVNEPLSQVQPARETATGNVVDSFQEQRQQHGQSRQKEPPYTMAGTVRDTTGEPLLGATVFIEGTEAGVYTNDAGRFVLDLSGQLAEADSATVVVSYIGYGRKKKTVAKADFTNDKPIELEFVVETQMELSVFSIRRPPLHKRLWSKFKAIFRRKK